MIFAAFVPSDGDVSGRRNVRAFRVTAIVVGRDPAFDDEAAEAAEHVGRVRPVRIVHGWRPD